MGTPLRQLLGASDRQREYEVLKRYTIEALASVSEEEFEHEIASYSPQLKQECKDVRVRALAYVARRTMAAPSSIVDPIRSMDSFQR